MLKKVLAISGSTRKDSSNLQIIKAIKLLSKESISMDIYDQLADLPHFNPDLDKDEPPIIVQNLRDKIANSDGILICTPEYVFSLPGALKNALEWTVSTTVFSEKPVALITASGLGDKAHEALQLVMRTIYSRFNNNTQLLLKGARNLVDENGKFTDIDILEKVNHLIKSFKEIMIN